MKDHLKTETGKTVRSSFFLVSLGVGLLFAFMSALSAWRLFHGEMGVGGDIAFLEANGQESKDNVWAAQNLYNSWIGADNQSLGAGLFYVMAPLLAMLPCGWNFFEELDGGYLHMAAPRRGRKPYFQAKLAVAFLAGGTVVALPQLANFLLTALYMPGVRPSVIYDMYTPIIHGDMLSGLFYRHPVAYIGVVIVMDFVFGGLFAWLPMAAAFFVRSGLAAVILPYLAVLLADSAKTILYYISYTEISPLNILHPMSAPNHVKGWVVLLWMAVLAGMTAPVILIRGCKREIF